MLQEVKGKKNLPNVVYTCQYILSRLTLVFILTLTIVFKCKQVLLKF